MGSPLDNQEEPPKKLPFSKNRLIQLGIAASFLLIIWGSWSYFQAGTSTKTEDKLFGIIEPINQVKQKTISGIKHRLGHGELINSKLFNQELILKVFNDFGVFDFLS